MELRECLLTALPPVLGHGPDHAGVLQDGVHCPDQALLLPAAGDQPQLVSLVQAQHSPLLLPGRTLPEFLKNIFLHKLIVTLYKLRKDI